MFIILIIDDDIGVIIQKWVSQVIMKELQATIAVKIFDWVCKKPMMTKNRIQSWLQKAFHSHTNG